MHDGLSVVDVKCAILIENINDVMLKATIKMFTSVINSDCGVKVEDSNRIVNSSKHDILLMANCLTNKLRCDVGYDVQGS